MVTTRPSLLKEQFYMKKYLFDRSEHVYQNSDFEELIKDAVRFFNGTPVHHIPPPERFEGAGVYALYYTGQFELYTPISKMNRLEYKLPIYIGKAVPSGWRQARKKPDIKKKENKLFQRIQEHSRNILSVQHIDINDFSCRFVIFEGGGVDMINTIEASLIKIYKPLWNTVLDGFGNHTPGKGRFEQAKSDWDVIHPGRAWAEKCRGEATPIEVIANKIKDSLKEL
jgi:hypothetical protein